MPIYSFECEECGGRKELKLKIDERNEEQKCQCGEPLTRVIEAPAPPIFKGDGFTPKFYK